MCLGFSFCVCVAVLLSTFNDEFFFLSRTLVMIVFAIGRLSVSRLPTINFCMDFTTNVLQNYIRNLEAIFIAWAEIWFPV
jgi:hypothetical protein